MPGSAGVFRSAFKASLVVKWIILACLLAADASAFDADHAPGPLTLGPWPASTHSEEDSAKNAAVVWASLEQWIDTMHAGKVAITARRSSADPRRGSAESRAAGEFIFDNQLQACKYIAFKDGRPYRHFISRSDQNATYFPDGLLLKVEDPSVHIEGHHLLQPIDPLGAAFGLQSEISMRLMRPRDFLEKYRDRSRLVECRLGGNGLYNMTLVSGKRSELRRRIQFDSSRSFVPTQIVLDVFDFKKASITEEVCTTDCEWNDETGTVLPRRIHMQCAFGGPSEKLIMDCEWSQINQPLGPEEFAIESLNIPGNVMVADSRLGQPILSRIGQLAESPPLDATAPRRWSMLRLVIIINVILAILAIAWFAKRRLRA